MHQMNSQEEQDLRVQVEQVRERLQGLTDDLRIVDDAGHEVPTGTSGEVIVRGPNVTPGYYGLPETNRETFRDGWFHTGDIGREDAQGFFYIVDRKKDMILSGGQNIYPADIEAVMRDHPAVADVAVVGVPSERWGETPLALASACNASHPTAMAGCMGTPSARPNAPSGSGRRR